MPEAGAHRSTRRACAGFALTACRIETRRRLADAERGIIRNITGARHFSAPYLQRAALVAGGVGGWAFRDRTCAMRRAGWGWSWSGGSRDRDASARVVVPLTRRNAPESHSHHDSYRRAHGRRECALHRVMHSFAGPTRAHVRRASRTSYARHARIGARYRARTRALLTRLLTHALRART
jgi:hypothetical protein